MKWRWPDITRKLRVRIWLPGRRNDLAGAGQGAPWARLHRHNPTSTRDRTTLARLRELPPVTGEDLTEITGIAANPGNLRLYRYLPDNMARKAALVVVLHGCAQNARNYALGSGWLQLARRHGFALMFAEQKRSNNANLCFNWYLPEDANSDVGEAQSIHAMVQTLKQRHSLNPSRIFITGLSAGGAMSCALMTRYPETFAAGAIIAGLPFGAANSMGQALAAMANPAKLSAGEWADLARAASPSPGQWPRLSIWHGSADRTVSPENARALERQWSALHCLGDAPTDELDLPGLVQRFWRDRTGTALVESIMIKGMAHGMAIDATGRNGPVIGQPGPFFHDVGIASALHIARSWDLVPE